MMGCNELIEAIYKHPKINELINTIQPSHLQDDLKQEFALIMLEYDCEKLIEISNNNKLIGFASRIIWKIGTLPKSKFYKIYRKDKFISVDDLDFADNLEPDYKDEIKQIENEIENKFLKDANEVHEAMIWVKYVEVQSCMEVAKYFGIPRLHVYQVVKKVKKDLKQKIFK